MRNLYIAQISNGFNSFPLSTVVILVNDTLTDESYFAVLKSSFYFDNGELVSLIDKFKVGEYSIGHILCELADYLVWVDRMDFPKFSINRSSILFHRQGASDRKRPLRDFCDVLIVEEVYEK